MLRKTATASIRKQLKVRFLLPQLDTYEYDMVEYLSGSFQDDILIPSIDPVMLRTRGGHVAAAKDLFILMG
jgi:hypothetical protein